MSVETSIVTACASAFSGRFFPAGDPGNENPALPFGTYQVISDQEAARYLSGRTGRIQKRVQINVYAQTVAECATKCAAVRAALESAFGDDLAYYERGADLPGDETTILGRMIDVLIGAASG